MSSPTTSTNPLILGSNIAIIALWAACQVVHIPYVVNLLVLVTSILYVACHNSLILREEQALSRGEKDPNDTSPPKDNEDRPRVDTLKTEDAMQFPLLGSASLFSLYLAFKFFDKEVVNLIISGYFGLVGCAALTATTAPLFEKILPSAITSVRFTKEIKIKHPLPEFIAGESPWDFSFDMSLSDVLALIASAVFSGVYLKTKHWTLNNVLGISFCLQGIERFSLGTYKIGAILLIGLFFYDIFWVFGTEVMVTVAKNVDGPIKILFPRSLIPNAETGKLELSLLGLGDIVIPGFFLALLLRFDAHNAKVPYFPTNVHYSFPKPYFHSALVAYVLGLGVTMFVMIYFEAAQPALLYLVPACLGSSLLCAMMRGEMKELFAYSEEEEEEEDEGKEKKEGEVKKETTDQKEEVAKKDD
uniref:Signal peptide peptidase n=1 Tax=Helicotheca tamesis TaxID=374047 RepID=A0A7S2MFE9_9STRA|mmetsp:Transcript_15304/g.20920  ORF Transcript_15304/g.20920 Transcript_15304/m.20920 type:complete len:416 (+) Transcript_15304:212-1459(+)